VKLSSLFPTYRLLRFAQVLLTLLIALVMGGIAIELSGKSSLEAYGVLFSSALSDWNAVANSLLAATPLILSGLGAAIAFRTGVFNIGVEGSIYLGAFASAWVGFTFAGLPALIVIPLGFLVGGLVGGVWCYVPGMLRARAGVDEIVTTIMLNYVAILLTTWLVNYPFRVPGLANAMSAKVSEAAQLPRIAPPSQLNIAFFVAVAAALVFAFLIRRTGFGYEVRNTGDNPMFARWSGIRVPAVIEKAMFLSGVMGGLAGTGQALGVNYRFVAGFSNGLGFTGIAIALLARHNPLAVLVAGLLFGMLRSGSSTMELFVDVPYDIVRILEAVIIVFASIDLLARFTKRRAHGAA